MALISNYAAIESYGHPLRPPPKGGNPGYAGRKSRRRTRQPATQESTMTPSTPINVRLNELRQELAALNTKRQQVYQEMAELKAQLKQTPAVPKNAAPQAEKPAKPATPAKPAHRSPEWMAYMRERKAEKAAQPTKQSTPQEHAKTRGAETAAWKIRRADGQLLKRTYRSEAEAREQIVELQRLVKGGRYTIVSV